MSKKGAKAQNKEQSYDFRDIVLAKVRGFPPWPGMVSNPPHVLAPGRDSRRLFQVALVDLCVRVDRGPGNCPGHGPEGASEREDEKGELVLCTVLPCW